MKSMPVASSVKRAPETAERSVTILGATGSIGASTIDLLKRERARYRVEAVSANRNAASLAALAREVGARFAAVGDPAVYRELKDELSGSGIEAAAGESGVIEAAQRPAQWVIGAITGAAGLRPSLAAAERGAIVPTSPLGLLLATPDPGWRQFPPQVTVRPVRRTSHGTGAE